MLNKQGSNSIVGFLVIAITMLILGVILLYIITAIFSPLATQFGTLNPEAGNILTFILNTFTNFWDWVIVLVVMLHMILLFVSAFLVDTHPVFTIFYIMNCFASILVGNVLLRLVNAIYDNPNFVTTVASLPYSDFLRTNFIYFYLGVIVLSGIVVYGKVRYFPAGYGGIA